MKDILVLGGTAFVSEETAKMLILQGYTVDILTRGICPLRYEGINRHILCDRTNPLQMKSALNNKKYDVIVDISARTSSDIEIVLSSVDQLSVEKYILCSTASVFEIPSNGKISDHITLEYSSENPYIIGKHLAEKTLIESGISYVIIRPTYIYGENNTLRRENAIFEAIQNNIPIFVSKTEYYINPVYSHDVAKCVLLAVKDNNLNASKLLLGGKDIVSFEQMVLLCSEICHQKAIIIRTKKDTDRFVKIPFLPITIIVETSDQVANYLKFTPLKNGLTNVYSLL